ncbi:MAG: transcription termination factor Rho [Coriobacteriia bacterium]|nr:transcription termination factor Rho [Coriobacteriia bacterium]MBS5478789.1 transcription termination factor Rho [Coriobacteriia bacterium]
MGIKMTPEISAALAAMPRRRRGRPSNEELQARKVLEDAIRRSEQQGDAASVSAPAAASDPARPVETAESRPAADVEPTSQPASEGAAAEQMSQPSSQGEQREEGGYQRRSHRVRQGQDGGFVPRHQRNQQRNGQQQDGQTRADRDGQGGQQGRQDRQDRQDRDRQGGRNDRNDRQGGNGQQGRQRQDGRYGDRQGDRGDRQDRYNDRRQQRRDRNAREAVAPKANREELAELKVGELRTKATELGIEDAASLKKPELIEAVYSALVKQEGFFDCAGVLDLMQEGYGFIRTKGYLPSEGDVYVGAQVIRSSGLRRGDWLVGIGHASRPTDKFPALARLESVNGRPVEEMRNRPRFADLTPVFPDERLRMEHGKDSILGRCIDLVSPIGKGQRGLIVSPPKAGKTTVLKKIAESIAENNPEVHLICLLVDERPEEVTDMQRSIRGEVVASTFDMPSDSHITVSELVIERAKRLVELGQDVVILLDSITRLARAYNLAQPASGRILSGGVDSTALYPPKRFLGAARNIEGGGSLTILASALVETGSKMDEVIFEEFKGTGNMELKLDRDLADRRIFPAIDPIASGTRKEELLLEPGIAPFVWGLRRILANMNNNERAMSSLIKSLKATATNEEFLIRSAKKAQNQEIGADLQ